MFMQFAGRGGESWNRRLGSGFIREGSRAMTTGTIVLWVAVALGLWTTSGAINLVTSLINLYRALKGEKTSWLIR